MKILSSSQIKEINQRLYEIIYQSTISTDPRLKVWSNDGRSRHPACMFIANIPNKRIAAIQLMIGSSNDIRGYLYQPYGLNQLNPGFVIRHELDILLTTLSKTCRLNKWLDEWLNNKVSVGAMERITGSKRVMRKGFESASALYASSDCEGFIFSMFGFNFLRLNQIDIVGASPNFGRFTFPISIDITSKKHNRMVTLEIDEYDKSLDQGEIAYFLKNVSEICNETEGCIYIEERLTIYVGFDKWKSCCELKKRLHFMIGGWLTDGGLRK